MTLAEAFSEIEEVYASDDAYRRYMRFFLALLHRVGPGEDDFVRDAVDVATRYWSGQTTASELEQVRLDCWGLIDKETHLGRREAHLRLLLFVLEPEDPEFMDSLDYAVRLFPRLGLRDGEVLELLTAFFFEVLGPTP